MRLLLVIAIVTIVKANIYYDMNNDSYEDVKNSRNFTGKVVLVTGSSSGIGEGTVKLFSILGAKVVITGRNATNIKSVAEEVHKLSPHGLKPLEVVADVTKEEDLKRLIDSTIKEFGKLDILVNNAALGTGGSVKDVKALDEFDSIFNTNLRSIVALIHLSLPYLQKTNGSIINISSIAALHPNVGSIFYSMAKAALDMMTKILAIELGPSGIRVNTINPGLTMTNMVGNISEEYIDIIAKSTPLRRNGEPLDIAKGVAFLASNDAQFITGANLVIDGGLVYNMHSSQ